MAAPYVWGWLVAVLAAAGLVFALGRAMRGWNAPLVKSLAGWWLFLFLAVPARIPRTDGELAPALLVYCFEAFLQRDGRPAAAGRVLIAASALALVLGIVTWLVRRRRRLNAAAGDMASAPAASADVRAGSLLD
jgi:hypothetical protein